MGGEGPASNAPVSTGVRYGAAARPILGADQGPCAQGTPGSAPPSRCGSPQTSRFSFWDGGNVLSFECHYGFKASTCLQPKKQGPRVPARLTAWPRSPLRCPCPFGRLDSCPKSRDAAISRPHMKCQLAPARMMLFPHLSGTHVHYLPFL